MRSSASAGQVTGRCRCFSTSTREWLPGEKTGGSDGSSRASVARHRGAHSEFDSPHHLDLRLPGGACLLEVDVVADGHGARCRGSCSLVLARLFVAQSGLIPEDVLTGDVPPVPVSGDGRDLAQPPGPPGRFGRQAPKALHPAVARNDRLFGQRAGPTFHRLVPLGQRPGQLGVVDTLDPRDQPGDEIAGGPPPASGRLSPAVHPAVQHCGHVGGVGQ